MKPYSSFFPNIREGSWGCLIFPNINIMPPECNFVTLSNCRFYSAGLINSQVNTSEDDYIDEITTSLEES